jgi:hypothetical protein
MRRAPWLGLPLCTGAEAEGAVGSTSTDLGCVAAAGDIRNDLSAARGSDVNLAWNPRGPTGSMTTARSLLRSLAISMSFRSLHRVLVLPLRETSNLTDVTARAAGAALREDMSLVGEARDAAAGDVALRDDPYAVGEESFWADVCVEEPAVVSANALDVVPEFFPRSFLRAVLSRMSFHHTGMQSSWSCRSGATSSAGAASARAGGSSDCGGTAGRSNCARCRRHHAAAPRKASWSTPCSGRSSMVCRSSS